MALFRGKRISYRIRRRNVSVYTHAVSLPEGQKGKGNATSGLP